MTPDPAPRPMAAFSLVELLVVIAIVAVLAGMLTSGIGLVRDCARSAACQGNLRQVGMALMAYAADWDGVLPPARRPLATTGWPRTNWSDWNWRAALETSGLLGNEAVGGAGNFLRVLGCPVQQRQPDRLIDPGNLVFNPANTSGWATYGANGQLSAIPANPLNGTALRRITQTAEVMLASDGQWTINNWNPSCSAILPDNRPETPHRGRCQVLYVDGHVAGVDAAWIQTASDSWDALGSAGRVFWQGGS